jgi:hypothetical protein
MFLTDLFQYPRTATATGILPKRSLCPHSRKVSGKASVAQQIARRIARQFRADQGRVFTPFDFLDLGSPHSVGMTLLRLARSGIVRRIGRGFYDVPRTHPLLGELLPTGEDTAKAVARKDGATIQPTEAMAANLLGLSEQVPVKVVYLTDGPSGVVTVGSWAIELRHRPRRKVGSPSEISSLIFSALRCLGASEVTKAKVAHLRKALKAKDRSRLFRDLPLAPAWMHPYFPFIAGGQA